MDKLISPGVWAEFGLVGLIILALFASIYWLLKQFKEERAEHRKERKEDRAEFRDDANRRDEKLIVALNSLENAVRSNN